MGSHLKARAVGYSKPTSLNAKRTVGMLDREIEPTPPRPCSTVVPSSPPEAMPNGKESSSSEGRAQDDSRYDTVPAKKYLDQAFSDSELIIGMVSAVGTDLRSVIQTLEDRLKIFRYDTHIIKVSRDIIPQIIRVPLDERCHDQFHKTDVLMTAGDNARKLTGDSSILALGVAAWIASGRQSTPPNDEPKNKPRQAYIIDSLKHPDEVSRLREIYPESFYLIGVHADESRRLEVLTQEKRIVEDKARKLMERDEDEHIAFGQRTSDTFQMSDFFLRLDESADKLKKDLWRVLDILLGRPYVTPLFDEFAMFMAFAAALRSADLSRQVGAVVARDEEIISTGANDCPRFGGGLYWPK